MLGLLTRLAGGSALPFALGVALAAGPISFVSYKLGRFVGYESGYAAADNEAEMHDLQRRLAERERDLSLAQEQSRRAQEQADQNTYAASEAVRVANEYQRELEALAHAANSSSPDKAPSPGHDPAGRAVQPPDVRSLSIDVGRGKPKAVRRNPAERG